MIYEELICFCGLTFLIPQRQKRKSHVKTVSINVSKTLGLLCLTLYRLHIKEIYDVKWSAKTCVCLKSVTSKQKQDTQKLNWVHSRMLLVSRWIELQKIKNKIPAFDKMNGKDVGSHKNYFLLKLNPIFWTLVLTTNVSFLFLLFGFYLKMKINLVYIKKWLLV